MPTATAQSATGTYTLDTTHTSIGFVARHAMVTKVRGTFNDFAGTGFFDLENPTNSNFELRIQAKSVDTRNADRDTHLRSNDFFDMEKFPEIKFVSTSVKAVSATNFQVTGDLTIKAVTKPVTIDLDYSGSVIDPWGNTRIGFEGKTVVNRKDWGVSWNAALEAGGVLVSEKVTLEFEISAVRSADAA